MKCPVCQAGSEVQDVRTRLDGSRRRRYECANLHRFSTEERVFVTPEVEAQRKARTEQICQRIAEGVKPLAVADEFGVSESHVYALRRKLSGRA